MSINPVTTPGPAAGPPTAEAAVRVASSSPTSTSSAQPESGGKPDVEIRPSPPTSEAAEMPQDEVQVQRVDGASGPIVIKYVDSSGHLILQIPSAQVLGLARAVEQALEEQADRRNRANESGSRAEGGTSDGY